MSQNSGALGSLISILEKLSECQLVLLKELVDNLAGSESEAWERQIRSLLLSKQVFTPPRHFFSGELVDEAEKAQLSLTVEMFEVIVASVQNDCKSLEILKVAYTRLGQLENSLSTSKKLVKAYVACGQISKAILECNEILKLFPDETDVLEDLVNFEAARLGPVA